MDSLEPIDMKPIRLTVRDNPPGVWLVTDKDELDVRPSLERLVVELLPQGCYVTLTLRADVESFTFPAEVVYVAAPVELPTASEVNDWIANGGLASSPGETVVEHLRARGFQAP